MRLCDRGCGKEAVYKTKNDKFVCDKNAGKCRACSSKGKSRTYPKPQKVNTERLCDFGCSSKAKYLFLNGKYCCSTTGGNCTKIRELAGKKISDSRYREVEPGTTLGKFIAQKGILTKSIKDKNGLNSHQRGAIKSAKTKVENIDPQTGLNKHQRNGLKYSEWLRTPAGINLLKEQSVNTKKRQNFIDPVTGIKEAKRRADLMIETKLKNIDENGLNGFDRGSWKNKNNRNSGMIGGVYFQSSNEKRFLLNMKELGLLEKIKRGPSFKYIFEGNQYTYISDYILDDIIFEIKSKYTMFGKNDEYLEKNIAKLASAKDLGYIVKLVIDDEIISLEAFVSSLSDRR